MLRPIPELHVLRLHAAAFTLLLVTGIVGACSPDTPPVQPAKSAGIGEGSGPAQGEHSPAPGPTNSSQGPTVAFLGDSIAAGLHLPSDEAFPAVLQRLLTEQGHPFRLVNGGVSGDTTAGGLRRIDWLLSQDPAVIVCEEGGNDGLRGIEPATIEANLRGIVEKAHAAGARVLLLGHVMPPNYGEDYTREFAAVFDRVADDLDVEYVPFFLEGVGGVPEFNFDDGLHPTAEGHRRIAVKVAPALRKLLVAVQ
ncbi:MAG: acyl-CoA thioesterase-1 [Chlamydiales bacterium]|jgi:acyl-CoA thioesterase-1